ncbi:MAG: NYN domain-containing protein [Oscillospiraceae bacterium]|nr:NYN domain-containing protein [Oscillospiraceae bacterium]
MLSPITKKTAILIDGGYYRSRAMTLWGKKSAKDRAEELYRYCMLHIGEPAEPRNLYRIFYYDCPPMSRSLKHPLTGTIVDFSAMPGTKWANDLYRHLSEKDRVALRMGELAESTASYILKDSVLDELLSGSKGISNLVEDDFRVDVKQKGVDMRIGLDVASLANGHHVDQIILIAGDSDFLPVVKMARKEGLEFILDPMKQKPKHTMIEHVDIVECYTDRMYPVSN